MIQLYEQYFKGNLQVTINKVIQYVNFALMSVRVDRNYDMKYPLLSDKH